jgi:hypothetical protein
VEVLNPALLPKVRSKAIMQAMRGYPCALRVSTLYPGHRCADRATVVGCHIPTIGKGISTKVSDLFVAAGCLHCHAIIDGVDNKRREYILQNYPAAYGARLLDGLAETQSRLVADGIIQVPSGEVTR